jgi:site-specific recombinase XerD
MRVIKEAYRRINVAQSGAHVLRHTLACRLVERGSSLKEVADVLRHRSLSTSLIYAKLDTPKLATVTLARKCIYSGRRLRNSNRFTLSRYPEAGCHFIAVAREEIMSSHISLQKRINTYLVERRCLGFQLRSLDTLLANFAQFVASLHHRGPLTIELMADWARQAKGGNGTRETCFRRLRKLRPFICYLKQFEPDTEVPKESIFGPTPGRVAPHIYNEEEIIELLVAAHNLGPPGSLRPETFETLF